MWETWVRSLGWEDPWRRKCQPTPVLLPGKSHGRRSLVGYSPWGCKELDTTERLHFYFSHLKSKNIGCYCLVTKLCLILCDSMNCVAHQAPLSMRFPRQEYWSGLPSSPPGNLPYPGIEHMSPPLADRFFTTESPGIVLIFCVVWFC